MPAHTVVLNRGEGVTGRPIDNSLDHNEARRKTALPTTTPL
jgi:hypothetical protein